MKTETPCKSAQQTCGLKRFLGSKGFITGLKIAVLVTVLVLLTVAVLWLWPWLPVLSQPGGVAKLKEAIDSFAPYSFFVLLGIQITQVVVAFIPGEPIEILGGVMFGTWGGLLVCELGLLIGSMGVYYLVRWLGKDLIDRLFASQKTQKLQKVLNSDKLPIVVFLLFFIPGTPKDMLTYLVPLTPMKPLVFFLISSLARIPSVITSTIAGSNLGNGNWVNAVITFGITGALGIGGILFHNWWMKKQEQKQKASKTTDA